MEPSPVAECGGMILIVFYTAFAVIKESTRMGA
jgi:hypothetical protein